jgi:hypothetical protein
VLRIVLELAAAAAAVLIIYLIYIELRNADHVWHAPCITPLSTREDVVYVVRAFRKVAEGKGISWWLDYGTLLGAWRIAGMMPFDHDADLAYAAEHKPILESCRAELAALGIELNTDRGIMIYRGEKVADIDPWAVHGGLRCREDPASREGLMKVLRWLWDDFPPEWVAPTWRIEFEGDMYPCPSHPDRLLRKRYPTCRIHLRLCFPHKQRCWVSGDFWRESWKIWRSRRGPVIQALAVCAMVSLGVTSAQGQERPPLTLTSPAFADSATIPTKYTCAVRAGAVSPPLEWSDAPRGTVSFAVIVHDLEPRPARGLDDVLHWMIWNIPATARQLAENVPQAASGIAYRGPCAPVGQPHHYVFELFALDRKLDAAAGAMRADLMKAMDGHVVGHAVLVGLFARPR